MIWLLATVILWAAYITVRYYPPINTRIVNWLDKEYAATMPHPRPKPVIGLCGGVGSGKSRVAAEFECYGCLVIDFDQISHEVLTEITPTLRDWWGNDILNEDGKPNRKKIAAIVFNDPTERERLEKFMHPLILARYRDIVQKSSPILATVIDAPLLFESGLDSECDVVVFVETSDSSREQRLLRSRGYGLEEARKRERWQLPIDEKRTRADFVIINDGPVENLRSQIEQILFTERMRYVGKI